MRKTKCLVFVLLLLLFLSGCGEKTVENDRFSLTLQSSYTWTEGEQGLGVIKKGETVVGGVQECVYVGVKDIFENGNIDYREVFDALYSQNDMPAYDDPDISHIGGPGILADFEVSFQTAPYLQDHYYYIVGDDALLDLWFDTSVLEYDDWNPILESFAPKSAETE